MTANAVGSIIHKLRWTDSTAVADKVVTSPADTLSIHPGFVGITVTHTFSKRLDVSIITNTLFSDIIEGRVNSALLA